MPGDAEIEDPALRMVFPFVRWCMWAWNTSIIEVRCHRAKFTALAKTRACEKQKMPFATLFAHRACVTLHCPQVDSEAVRDIIVLSMNFSPRNPDCTAGYPAPPSQCRPRARPLSSSTATMTRPTAPRELRTALLAWVSAITCGLLIGSLLPLDGHHSLA